MVPNVGVTWIAWRDDREYFAACARKRDLENFGVVVVLMDERWRNTKSRAADSAAGSGAEGAEG
jgi:hypothetical protein